MSSEDRTSGGAVGLLRPVTDFYARVLRSPRLAHHFEGAAMEALIAKQTAFISATVSGETRYSFEDLERVHARFLISDSEFDELIALLKSTLDDHHVAADLQRQITATFEEFRDSIVHGSIVRS